MSENNAKYRMGSVFIIIILVTSGLLVGLPLNSNVTTVQGESLWLQTSDKHFNNGTFLNTTIMGKGEAAELQIDLSDIQTWTKKSPSNNPVAGPYHNTASVWGTDKVISFGGYWYYGGYRYNNETWVYDYSDDKWTKKYPMVTPSPRYWHALATIGGTDKILLFGGIYSGYLSDTWIYDVGDNTWTDMNPTNSPGMAAYHAMAAVDGTSKVILFGGAPYYNITWMYDFTANNWERKASLNSAIYRYYHSLSTIYGTDKILLFGGYYYTYDETWVYDLSDDKWTQKFPSQLPAYRWWHAMAPVWGTDNIVLFGGYGYYYSYYAPLNDTWVYDYSDNTWTQKQTKNRPGAAYYHSMATIWGTDRVLLYGGYAPSSGYWAETWVYRHHLPSKNGTYQSKPYDLGSNSSFYQLDWFYDIPDISNSSLRLQLRSAKTKEKLASEEFVGPEGTTESFYTFTPDDIWPGHDGDRWVQYKAYFNIDVYTDSPCLKEVSISYNCLPETIVIGPVSGSLIINNKPTFAWTFEDVDSEKQKAFHVIIANDSKFENIHYDSGIQTSQEQTWKFPTGTSYTDMVDGMWYWKVRTKDGDDAWTDYGEPWELKIDTQLPSSAPTLPVNDGYYNSVPMITGLATDPKPSSGVAQIEIAIKRLTDNYFWTGTQWVPLNTWLVANGTSSWHFDARTITWTSGAGYQVQSRATDHASNLEVPGRGNEFTVDMDHPISKIEFPNDESWLNKLNSIQGSSMDIAGSGVTKVEISIKCIKDLNTWDGGEKVNSYWDGKEWLAKEAWLAATGTDNWEYNASDIKWTTSNHYLISSRAMDKPGNMEVPGKGTTFMYDATPPHGLSIYINNGDQFTILTRAILALTGEDIGSGVAHMSFSTDNIEWSSWEPFNTSFELQLPAGDAEKTVYYRVRDYAGNIADPVSDTIILDTTPPKDLIIRINGNTKYTNLKNVKLDLRGTDALSGVGDMTYSFDSITWFPWESFKELRYTTIPGEDGERVVFFKLRDKAGNIAEPVYDTIILDSKPPHSLVIVVNHGATETNSTVVTLNVNAIDEISRVSDICFSHEGDVWTSWENYTLVRYYNLPPGYGPKIIYFKVKDSAGNIADPVSTTITLTAPPESVSETRRIGSNTDSLLFWVILLIVIIIILVLIIAGLILKRRRRPEEVFPGAVTIKPGGLFAPTGSLAQIPSAIQLTQLPTTVAVGESQQLAAAGTSTGVPILVKSAAGTAQIMQLPALPPAKLDLTDQTTIENFTPAPSNQPESPATVTPIPTVTTPIVTPPAVAIPSTIPTPQPAPVHTPKPAPVVHLPGSTPQPTVATPIPTPPVAQPTVATPAPTVAPAATPTVTPTVATPSPSTPQAQPATQDPDKKVRIKDIL